MPLQNRVTPFGEIVAIPQRGLLMGNRGIIHDPATRTLTTRRWSNPAWLICRCDYKGARRAVMAQRSWTELFFLDEATALAAGHRPCFLCRRAEALQFQRCWAAGNGTPPPPAPEIDRVLHRERLHLERVHLEREQLEHRQRGRKRLHPVTGSPADLPSGAMVAIGQSSYLIVAGRAHRWTPDGYQPAATLPQVDGLLTPPSTLRTLMAGYRPILHPSAIPALPS